MRGSAPATADESGISSMPLLVVGGGPAGAMSALLLARRGWSVELVDRARFPRPKACGECLNPSGVRILERHGLLHTALEDGPNWLVGWDLAVEGGPWAEGRFGGADRALTVERSVFDFALLNAAREAGVVVREGVELKRLDAGGRHDPVSATLSTRSGREERRTVRLLIGADGLHSRVAALAGLSHPPQPPHKASASWRIRGSGPSREVGRLVLADGLTAGLAPVGPADGDLWNATLVADLGRHPQMRPSRSWATLLALLRTPERTTRSAPPLPVRRRLGWRTGGPGLPRDSVGLSWDRGPEGEDGPWRSGSFHRPVRSPGAGRILLVGDAAGYFDPLTGQGIRRALRSAALAVEAVDAHVSRTEGLRTGARRLDPRDVEAADRYAAALHRELRFGRLVQLGVEGVVRRRGLRRASLAFLARFPVLASGLIRITGDRPSTVIRRSEAQGPPRPPVQTSEVSCAR